MHADLSVGRWPVDIAHVISLLVVEITVFSLAPLSSCTDIAILIPLLSCFTITYHPSVCEHETWIHFFLVPNNLIISPLLSMTSKRCLIFALWASVPTCQHVLLQVPLPISRTVCDLININFGSLLTSLASIQLLIAPPGDSSSLATWFGSDF